MAESTTSRVEAMKPVILKAGIPLAISVTGFICAKIMVRRSLSKEPSLQDEANILETNHLCGEEESLLSPSSSSMTHVEEEDPLITESLSIEAAESKEDWDKPSLEEETSSQRSGIQDLQRPDKDLWGRFLSYQTMKEQELVLVELRSMLQLELAHMKFLDRVVSSMESETRRLEGMVTEYVKVLETLEYQKARNIFLKKKVKKLLRTSKEKSRVIQGQNSRVEELQAELVRNTLELETKNNILKKMEDEARELQALSDQLEEEKNEALKKLELIEESSAASTSKNEAEVVATTEDYMKLADELEQLQKDRANEVKELIHLRWTNACLRHQLMRHQEQEELYLKENHLELDCEAAGNHFFEQETGGNDLELNMHFLAVNSDDQAHSKRAKLVQKFRRWMDGGERMRGKSEEIDRHESKCFGRHSVSGEAHEKFCARSSSSA